MNLASLATRLLVPSLQTIEGKMCSEEGLAGALAAKDLLSTEELTRGKAWKGFAVKPDSRNSATSCASKPYFGELAPEHFAVLSCTSGTN